MTIVLQNYWFGDVHEDVHHCGAATTLNKLRQTYWIIKRRQTVKKVLSKCKICKIVQGKTLLPLLTETVKKVLSKCIICKIVQGKTLLPLLTAKLPEYRLYFEYPFEMLD